MCRDFVIVYNIFKYVGVDDHVDPNHFLYPFTISLNIHLLNKACDETVKNREAYNNC